MQALVVELEAGEPVVSIKAHKFTAAPASGNASSGATTATSSSSSTGSTPKLYRADGEDSAESDTDSCAVGYTAALSKSQIEKAKARALSKVAEVYPRAAEKVVLSHVVPPTLGGHRLANLPTKYAATALTATTDIKNLFLCGRDIATTGTAADFQGGWAAANAVLGYTPAELIAGRNLATDLQFMRR
jgi:hypothetical protein